MRTGEIIDKRSPVQVKERIQVLFLNLQSQPAFSEMGLPQYEQLIADFTQLEKDQITVVNIADGEALPKTIEAHGVIGGGAHTAPLTTSWMNELPAFFRAAQRTDIPELDICWSHQLRSQSFYGMVANGKNGVRFGVEHLQKTPAGHNDPLFRGLPSEFALFNSHTDVVETIPSRQPSLEVVELAESTAYPHEVLSYGKNVRTIQSHPEINSTVIYALARFGKEQQKDPSEFGPSVNVFQAYLDALPDLEVATQIEANGKMIGANWIRYFVAPYHKGK